MHIVTAAAAAAAAPAAARFVFEKAKELGVHCVILDGPEK
jgi:hypothetical protein